MQADQLAKHAKELADFLKSTGHPDVSCRHDRSDGLFINVYKAPLPTGAGVYLFHFDDDEVFYIGKTEAERDDFARIWHHLGSAAKLLDTGKREFPANRFAVHFLAGSNEIEAVRAGNFRIDYLVVEPPALTSLFEVYLQTMCVSKDGHWPKCNRRIG